MGGWNSGRRGGRPTVESGLTISLPWLIRRGGMVSGGGGSGTVTWSTNGQQTSSIGYSYGMWEPDFPWMELRFTCTPYGSEPRSANQRISLTCTRPNYGGRRWWMLCPQTNKRVLKLHLPPGGDKFLSREAWGLGYRSQRVSHSERTLEKLFKLQQKLGGEPGWDRGLPRPKGMWQRTYDRHLDRYDELDVAVGVDMMRQLDKLRSMAGTIGIG
ncbi:hypothetical protein [Emcibacter sp. SYSU 3D8]|uniref:hypothetical protein n=1 Tax=Emcibacter sp. SYSU 3D8 TaxID=3133969 RepID=UPI0031FE6D68